MRTLSRHAVVFCVVMTLAITTALAESQDFVHLTLQGRLSDLVGTAVPDGTHNVEIAIQAQDGQLPWIVATTVETKDGLFSVTLENVPLLAFECDDAGNPCAQMVGVRMVDDDVTLPWISLGQTGRAGVAARLNGDVETSPGRIDFPATNELEQQTAFMSDGGMEFVGVNGQPTLKFDNRLVPGHQLPTLDIANPTLTTIGGPTSVLNSFTVNVGLDATPDFSVDNISGVYSKDQIVSFNPTPTSRFDMQFDGDIFLNSYSSGAQDLADLELLNGGGATIRSTSVAFDRNNDNTPDIHFLSNGNCRFNSDNTGGYDLTLETNWIQANKPVRIDPDGDGSNQYLFEANQCTFNPDEDAFPEVTIDGFTATFACGTVFDVTPSVFGENGAIGNNIAFFDPNADGTREINMVGGKTNLNGVLESKHDAASANPSMLLGDDALDIDVDQNGVKELRIGKNLFTEETFVAVDSDFEVWGKSVFVGTLQTQGPLEVLSSASFEQPVVINSSLEVNTATGVVINGDLTVTGTKNFAQAHPTDPTKEIIYTALEAGESGTYTRGTAALSNGVAVIELPEHFALVTNASGLTAQITPRGPVQSMLYVESVSPTRIVVKSSNPADATVPFDFMVNGVRAGFENNPVIRTKSNLASSR